MTKVEETLEKIQVFWDRGPFLGPWAVLGQPLPSKKKEVSQSKIPQNMKAPPTKNQAWPATSDFNPTREKPTQFKISKKTKKVGLHPSITDGVHRTESFVAIILVFSTFSNFFKKKKNIYKSHFM